MSTNAATESTPRPAKPAPVPRNGVDLPTLFATIDAIRAQPELGDFQFRASNRWVKGTHSRSRMEPFSGAGGVHSHAQDFSYDADHHAVLCGDDEGATPVEFLLHALCACLTAGIANVAAARGINLTEVTSSIEGDIDLKGILGISDEVRNGFQELRISFTVRGDAPEDELRELVEQSRRRSAVFDTLLNGTSIAVEANAD